jgi:SpoVK/Ycf46/Vps4 family AAA+-type ATPase
MGRRIRTSITFVIRSSLFDATVHVSNHFFFLIAFLTETFSRIFFDEIDGLAPVRSSRQDQIHSSIVSTLLALMDGLDERGEVIIIGNLIDL